jgi:hypothetical protein
MDFTGFRAGIVYDGVAQTVAATGAEPGAANILRGFETIMGSAAKDRFADGAGDMVYFGQGGADDFVFRPGHGTDQVFSFERGQDRIELQGHAASFGADAAAITAFLAARLAPGWDSGQRWLDTSLPGAAPSRIAFVNLAERPTAADFLFT